MSTYQLCTRHAINRTEPLSSSKHANSASVRIFMLRLLHLKQIYMPPNMLQKQLKPVVPSKL